MLKRCRKGRLFEHSADSGHLVIEQERFLALAIGGDEKPERRADMGEIRQERDNFLLVIGMSTRS